MSLHSIYMDPFGPYQGFPFMYTILEREERMSEEDKTRLNILLGRRLALECRIKPIDVESHIRITDEIWSLLKEYRLDSDLRRRRHFSRD